MKWTHCKNYPINIKDSGDEEYFSEIQRKELSLRQKEKELLKKEKILQRKICKFNKRKKNKAKNDLKAAAKLRDARKKLLFTLDTKEKVQTCDMRTCKKWNKTHVREESTKQRKKRAEKVKRDLRSPVQYFNDLIHRTCECSAHEKKKYLKDPDFCLRKLFGRPSLCKNQNKNAGGHSPRKSGQESTTRENHWERAAGDCYSMSLRRPPPLWLYTRWPQFYPQYLDAKQQCNNCKHLLLFVAGILFWTPCLLCLELCKCCFCACCTE